MAFSIIKFHMQQSIRILCNIYNFIPVASPPAVTPNLQPIEQFRQIFLLISEFVTGEYMHPRSIFEELCLFINKEEEVFGPRKFGKMNESISCIIAQFVAGKLRAGSTDIVVLSLTYYHRYCQRHFTPPIRTIIAILHALAHFQKNTVDIAQNYIAEARQLVKTAQKEAEETVIRDAKMMLELLEGIACLRKHNYSRAKFIFSEAIGQLTHRMHLQQTRNKRLSYETASFFTVSTYFLAEAYEKLAQLDRAAYHITQCLQFTSVHLENHEALSQHLTSMYQFAQTAAVKLGRTENKIQRIKSLHNFHSRSRHTSTMKQSKENLRVHFPQFKITKRAKQLKISQTVIKKELQNIMVLEEGSEGGLKKKTLRELRGEQLQKERKIDIFEEQIINFHHQKQVISQKYPNELYCDQIKKKQQQMESIQQQINSKIWGVVGTLKPTKRIQAYLHGFASLFTYEKTNNFIKFLYNQVSFRSHMKLYSILRKIRSKLVRQSLRQLKIEGVRHQVELSRHKIAHAYHMKIYQIEKGPGVNIEQEISIELYEGLKEKPFCFSYHVENGRIVPFHDYLNRLPECLLMRMKLFSVKLVKKVQMRKNQLLFRKKEVNITFGTYYNQLRYLVFVTSRKVADGRYSHAVQRIDRAAHHNSDYNIKINQTFFTKSLEVCQFQLSQLITRCILQQKSKHAWLITKIQQMFRYKLAHLQLLKRKESVQVNTLIIRRSIYSLIVNGNNRTFYIQNLDGKYPVVRMPNVTFYNLSFIHKIRNQLVACEDCQQQIAVINKFFRLRNFAYKFIKKSQEVKLDTKFSTKFKKSLCFAKVMRQYLYRGKLIEGRMMYMLTVKNFEAFPRPYLLRVFTIEHKSLYSVDCEQVIFNSEKIYLENNLERINHFLDIQDHRRVSILDGPYKIMGHLKRQNSKSTLVSNFTFGSGEDFLRQRKSRLGSRMLHARESNLNNRNKKNSINFKMRHKSALKQKDILLIKKWIQDSKEDSSISESEESSTA